MAATMRFENPSCSEGLCLRERGGDSDSSQSQWGCRDDCAFLDFHERNSQIHAIRCTGYAAFCFVSWIPLQTESKSGTFRGNGIL